MKLKYYLRGLGIGIIVTAIIMSFTRQPEKLTDAQIKLRALELGMVEESVLADLQEEDELASNEEVLQEDSFQEEMSSEEVAERETEELTEDMTESETEEVSKNNDSSEESTETEKDSANDELNVENNSTENSSDIENSEVSTGTENDSTIIEENSNDDQTQIPENEVVESYIVISVVSGNGSEVVSRKLYEAGLVNSSVEFNQFLVRNGYDRKLKVGNHEIPAGATQEEMAKILCGMQ